MGNYDQMLAFGRKLFLEWNQDAMIRRYNLRADDGFLYIDFLGRGYRICRQTGRADEAPGFTPAEPTVALTLYDYLCRDNPMPGMGGKLCPVNALKHVAQSSPDTVSLHRPHALKLQEHLPALKTALEQTGLAPFPQGDAACIFSIFDGFNAVFQFWEGDDEFEPSVRFLWDENALSYLRYETTYYVMGAFLDRLHNAIAQIEKNVN